MTHEEREKELELAHVIQEVPQKLRSLIKPGYPKTVTYKIPLTPTGKNYLLTELYLEFPNQTVIYIYKYSVQNFVYFKYGLSKHFNTVFCFLRNSFHTKTLSEAILRAGKLALKDLQDPK